MNMNHIAIPPPTTQYKSYVHVHTITSNEQSLYNTELQLVYFALPTKNRFLSSSSSSIHYYYYLPFVHRYIYC